MSYLLFVNFNNDLMHNAIYKKLEDILESIRQLIQDEGLDVKSEKILNIAELKEYLNKYDDYFGQLSNGTWYHIQPKNVFATIK